MEFDDRLPTDGINVSPEHPLRELAVLLGGLLAAVLGIGVVAALAVDWIVPRLPPGVEMALFGGLAPDPDAEATDPRAARVQALLDRLAAHGPETPYAFRVDVMDAEEPNAFALPGGMLLVTSGLLERATSENELAFVLGHELGHFHDRDHLRGLGRGVATGLVLAALGATGADVTVALADTASGLAERSFGREQEREADAFGLALVHAEYGHVAGATDFFQHLPDPDGAADDALAGWLSTHPRSAERADALRRLARERVWRLGGETRALDIPAASEERTEVP